MLRAVLGSLAVAVMCVGSLAAADKANTSAPNAKANANHEWKGLFVKVDATHNTLTFLKLEGDKGVETTMPLAKNAKIIGEDNKPETLKDFASHLRNQSDHPIMVTGDKDGKQVTEVKDLPSKKTKK
jgi:hypothetical protein